MEQEKSLKEEFDAVDKRFAKIDARFDQQTSMWDSRFDEQSARWDDRFNKQGVILEDIQTKVQLLAEGQDFIHEQIDRLDTRVSVLQAK